MASPGGAEECNNVSVMVIQSFERSPTCQGSEPTLLGFSSVRLKPVPDQLRFSAAMTLHRLDGSVQVSARVSKIRKRPANLALDQPANFDLGGSHLVAGAPWAYGWSLVMSGSSRIMKQVPAMVKFTEDADRIFDQHLPARLERAHRDKPFRGVGDQPSRPSPRRPGATRPSKPRGTSRLRVPTPVSVGTPSACASWPGLNAR